MRAHKSCLLSNACAVGTVMLRISIIRNYALRQCRLVRCETHLLTGARFKH